MLTYTLDRLWEETVYLAYYLHWPLEDILGLTHSARARVIGEVGKINARLSGGATGLDL
ncbi:MAG TPA: DUF6760 family protein [Streptosporangiaceae bacterium]|nr:DUF6760 family protein [Streptosporangiaceae bacterium]